MRCEICRFWVKGEQWGEESGSGSCHRHAPQPNTGAIAYEVLKHLTTISWSHASEWEQKNDFNDWESTPQLQSSWPTTAGDDWCGDWQAEVLK